MKVIVGSGNPVKVQAVREVFSERYPGVVVEGRRVETGVGDQPLSMEETVEGAVNRAKRAFSDCDYSVGLEDGLFEVPETESGFLNGCVCAVFDGERVHLGISSLFEFPREVNELIHGKGLDANQAAFESGFSKSKSCGSEEGMIGILSKGTLKRKDYNKQAVFMALLHLKG